VLLKPDTRHLQVALPPALWRLRIQPRWLVWKWKWRNGKFQKPPIDDDGRSIDAHDPNNWMSYEEACARLACVGSGLGFALKGSGIGVLDLDGCRPEGAVRTADWALALGRRARSYTELSSSGEGLHILGFAAGAEVYRQRQMEVGKLEIFRDRRQYITVSGQQIWGDYRLRNIDDVINALTNDELRPTVVAAVGTVGTIEIETCRDSWQAVLRRRMPRLERYLASYVTRVIPKHWRSDVIWKIGRTLREGGCTTGEVAVVLEASRCFQDKWGGNAKALRGEVTRIFLKPLRGRNGG
jgi:hypothetical protein